MFGLLILDAVLKDPPLVAVFFIVVAFLITVSKEFNQL